MRLKESAASAARSAVEASGLRPALDVAMHQADAEQSSMSRPNQGASEALKAALKQASDSRLADPMLFITLGFICTALAADAEAGLDMFKAKAVRREAIGAFRVALELTPGDLSARTRGWRRRALRRRRSLSSCPSRRRLRRRARRK